jgi:hypothetical protein
MGVEVGSGIGRRLLDRIIGMLTKAGQRTCSFQEAPARYCRSESDCDPDTDSDPDIHRLGGWPGCVVAGDALVGHHPNPEISVRP